jgi:streptogramin lyase
MTSHTREHELRTFLERMAAEMPTPAHAPPRAIERARGRLVRTVGIGVVLAIAVAAGALSGARALLEADRSSPAVDPQIEPIVTISVRPSEHVAVGAGGVWVAGGSGISRVDPETNEVVASFPGASGPLGSAIAIGEGGVWVSGGAYDGEIVRIDPVTNEIAATIHTGGYDDPYALVAGGGYVWATTHGDATLLRIDPESNAVVSFPAPESGPRPDAIHGVAVLDGVLWVTASSWDDGYGTPYALDPATGAVIAHIPVRVHDLIWAGFGSLWAFEHDGRVVRLDPASGSELAHIRIRDAETLENFHLAMGEDAVWVADGIRLYRIDPTSNEVVASLRFRPPVQALAAGAGAVWVLDATGALHRIDPDAVDESP